jgi:hypothetical protein
MPYLDEDEHRASARAYYQAHPEQVKEKVRAWLKKKPCYSLWSGIKQRCYNPNHPKFHLYGALGVRVCGSWRESFTAFMADMGPRPSLRHSVDRFPDPDGDYEPTNCRWATPLQQRHNRRNVIKVNYI